jgi:DNA replication and repair protein RecF
VVLQSQPMRHFASQGQQRTYVLALKLLQHDLWHRYLGYPPLLILDDALAELDPSRQQALLSSLPRQTQAFVTATHLPGPIRENLDCEILDLSRDSS